MFLWNKFKVLVTTYSIGRALKSIRQSKKTVRYIAQGRNTDLRDLYIHNTTDICSQQFVYMDESGCDTRAGLRRTGQSPLGVTPRFKREKR